LSAARVVAAAASVATLVGCATILGLEHNDSEDAGSDAGFDVAKIVVHDAHMRDVGTRPDAGGPDAATQPDARTDASLCPSAFCACLGRDAALCLDFDEGTHANAFGVAVTVGGGELSLAPSSLSPPQALESFLPGSGAAAQATLGNTVGVSANYDLNFDLQIGPCALQGSSAVVTLLLSTGAKATVDLFGLDGGFDGGVAASTGSSALEGAIPVIPLGMWTAVRLQVAPGEEVLTVGPTDVTSLLEAPADAALSDSATLQIGQLSPQSGACTIFVDNLTLDHGI
jgi:hypothetical protein